MVCPTYPAIGGILGSLGSMARAKIWLGDVEHCDNRNRWAKLAVGKDIVVGVTHGPDGRLHVSEMWPGAHTTIHGRLVGIEWHEMTDDDPGAGLRVDSTEDHVPDADNYAFELTVATRDWLPH